MIEYKTLSGAKVLITLSDFDTSFDLTKAVMKAADANGKTLETITVADMLTSKDVENLAFKCMERCTYNDGVEEKISRDTFEKESRRGDFLDVIFEVIKVNISPFFSRLASGSQAGSKK